MSEEKIKQDTVNLDAEILDEVAGGSNGPWYDPLNKAKDNEVKKCPKCGAENVFLKAMSPDQKASCRSCGYRGAKKTYL